MECCHISQISLYRARIAGGATGVLRRASTERRKQRAGPGGRRRAACSPTTVCRRHACKRMGRHDHVAQTARAQPIPDYSRQRPSLVATGRGALRTARRPTGPRLREQVGQ